MWQDDLIRCLIFILKLYIIHVCYKVIFAAGQETYQFSSFAHSVWLFTTPWTAACQASLFITNSWSFLRFMFIDSVIPSNHLILCHPLLLLPSIFPSFRVFPMSQLFTSSGQSIGVSASASVLPMNIQDWIPLRCSGWISLQSKGIPSVLQHYGSKASILRCSLFFVVQLSYMPLIHTWLLEKP